MLTEISSDKLLPFIDIAFSGDEDLFTQWHINSGTQQECILHTYHTILDTEKLMPITCYHMGEIGYTVIIPDKHLLYSFGINKEHRNKETLKNWFDNIVNILGTFDCILWSKNKRAINHLLKQGMTIKNKIEVYTILTYTSCQ